MMPRSLFWAREQSVSSRVFVVRVSCVRMVLLISGVLLSFHFLVAAMDGRKKERKKDIPYKEGN
jgi:hypothetical protein